MKMDNSMFGLKGLCIIAQPIGLGMGTPPQNYALKGQRNTCRQLHCPYRAWWNTLGSEPRAVPWAKLACTFSAK